MPKAAMAKTTTPLPAPVPSPASAPAQTPLAMSAPDPTLTPVLCLPCTPDSASAPDPPPALGTLDTVAASECICAGGRLVASPNSAGRKAEEAKAKDQSEKLRRQKAGILCG